MGEKNLKEEIQVLTRPQRCKQCGICVKRCPKKAIAFGSEINKAGYHYTIIDHESCIACGTCYMVCPDGVYEILGD